MAAVEKRSFGRVENGLFLSNKMKMSPRISKDFTNLASLKLIINGNSCVCRHYVFRLSLKHLGARGVPKIGTAIHLEFRMNWLHCAGRHHSTESEEQIVATFRLRRLFCSFALFLILVEAAYLSNTNSSVSLMMSIRWLFLHHVTELSSLSPCVLSESGINGRKIQTKYCHRHKTTLVVVCHL